MLKLRFHPAARAELASAVAYHEDKRPGYGAKFRAEVRAVVEQASELPGSGVRDGGYPETFEVRAFRLRVFPYALIVSVEPEMLLVVAVSHTRRRPGYWRDRL